MFFRLTVFMVSIMLLASCAKTTQMGTPSFRATGNTKGSVPQDKAIITVIRPSVMGSAIKFKLYANDDLIAKLGPDNFVSWVVDPGQVNLRATGENKEFFTVNAEAGEEYFIKLRIKPGVLSGQADLRALTDEEGVEMLEKVRKPDVNAM